MLGRIVEIRSAVKDVMSQSKQMGRRENKSTNIEGRVQYDMMQVGYTTSQSATLTIQCRLQYINSWSQIKVLFNFRCIFHL